MYEFELEGPKVPPKNFGEGDYELLTEEEQRGGNSADSGITLQDIARNDSSGEGASASEQPLYHTPEQTGRFTEQEYYELGDVYADITAQIPPDFDFSSASVSKVSEILRLLRLHKYILPFRNEDIDGAFLLEITKPEMAGETRKLFSMNAIHFRKLQRFVHEQWRPQL